MSSVASDQHVSPLGYTLDQVMDFLDACEKYLLSDAYVETMGKGTENLKPREKQEVLRNRFQNESKEIWRRVVLKGASSKVGDDFLNNALQYFVNQKREFALYQRYQQFEEVERERFLVALHGKELSEARKSRQQELQVYGQKVEKVMLTLSIGELEEKMKKLHPVVRAWNQKLDKIPLEEQDIYCTRQPFEEMKPLIQMQILQQVMQIRLRKLNDSDENCNKGG
eukprot:g15706.t1